MTQQTVCSNVFLTMNIKCVLILEWQRNSVFLRLELKCIWKDNSRRRVFYCVSQMGHIFSWRFSAKPIRGYCGFSISSRNKASRIFYNLQYVLSFRQMIGGRRVSINNILIILVFYCLWFIICLPVWFMLIARFFFNYFGDLFRIIRLIWLLKKINSFTQWQEKYCKFKWWKFIHIN